MVNLAPDARILIVRLSAIGDVVHALPVLNALRGALPRAFLAWIVESPAADLLRSHRALDVPIVVPRGWLKSPRTALAVRRRLRALRFDAVIDVQGLSKSALAGRLARARRRIGFGGKDGREVSRWLNNELAVASSTHVVDRNLELLGLLGIAPSPARFDIEDTPAQALAADRLLESRRLLDGFALLNPGAGWQSKLWPPERYAAVARHLGRARSLKSLVAWAGEREKAWAEQIVAGSGGCATLAPATDLKILAAIARRASLFVGSDTAPLHLAAAVGTPCVGLFGPTAAERNGPYGPQHVTVQKMRVTGRGRRKPNASRESMEAITVDDVAAACEQIIERRVTRRSA
jgi:lipopolysaccharide heptosyltransferase I